MNQRKIVTYAEYVLRTSAENEKEKDKTPTPHQLAARRAAALQKKMFNHKSRYERKVEAILSAAGIEWNSRVTYYGKDKSNFYILPIFIKATKIAIFVENTSFRPKSPWALEQRRTVLEEAGIRSLAFSISDVKELTKSSLLSAIAEVVGLDPVLDV